MRKEHIVNIVFFTFLLPWHDFPKRFRSLPPGHPRSAQVVRPRSAQVGPVWPRSYHGFASSFRTIALVARLGTVHKIDAVVLIYMHIIHEHMCTYVHVGMHMRMNVRFFVYMMRSCTPTYCAHIDSDTHMNIIMFIYTPLRCVHH